MTATGTGTDPTRPGGPVDGPPDVETATRRPDHPLTRLERGIWCATCGTRFSGTPAEAAAHHASCPPVPVVAA